MSARRVLDAVFDVLTLVAIVIAAIGHLFDWFDTSNTVTVYNRERQSRRVMTNGAFARNVPEAVDAHTGTATTDGVRSPNGSSAPNAEDGTEKSSEPDVASVRRTVRKVQAWHAGFSAAALGVAALLVFASLLIDWSRTARKLLVFLMLLALLTALGFQVLVFSSYPLTDIHRELIDQPWRPYVYPSEIIALAIAPTAVAAVLTLVRMVWTMPHLRGNHATGASDAASV